MEPTTATFTITDPDFLDQPPSLPDGASVWERQELGRLWGDALSNLSRVAALAVYLHGATRTHVETSRPNVGGGGLAYYANQADAALVAYHQLHQAVRHRLHLAASGDGPRPDPVQASALDRAPANG